MAASTKTLPENVSRSGWETTQSSLQLMFDAGVPEWLQPPKPRFPVVPTDGSLAKSMK